MKSRGLGDVYKRQVREGADHAVNAGVPRLWGAADVSRRLRDIFRPEHSFFACVFNRQKSSAESEI